MPLYNKNSFLFCLLLFTLILCSCGKKDEFIESVKKQAEEQGLKDVSVTLKEDDESGYYMATIKSSNFNDFTPEEMLQISGLINDYIMDGVAMDYVCGDDKYFVSVDTRTINKNDEYNWYNDFENSSVHNSTSSNDSDGNDKTYDVDDDDERVECWTLATEAVKKKLKLPSSAKFPFSASSDGVSITKNVIGDIYYVSAWVEAENSFGGSVRSNFCVTLSYDKSDFSVITTVIDN